MGVYDRDYYRDDSMGSGWFSGTAPACKAIIVLNAIVFIAFFRPDSPLKEALEANSDAIFKHGHVWQLLTSAFLHKDIAHIVWNMLFLWMIGRDVEARLGSREFTIFYLVSAVFSALMWAIADRFMLEPGSAHMLGASGAISAVLLVYVLDAPRRELLLMGFIPIQAWVLPAVFLCYDTLGLLQSFQLDRRAAGPQTAFAGHLGGALYGFLFWKFDLRLDHLFSRRGRRPRLRIVSPPPRERERTPSHPATSSRSASVASTAKAASPSSFPPEQLDARLDEVLAKIAREGGRSGLSEEEHRILEEASRRARDRRSDRP